MGFQIEINIGIYILYKYPFVFKVRKIMSNTQNHVYLILFLLANISILHASSCSKDPRNILFAPGQKIMATRILEVDPKARQEIMANFEANQACRFGVFCTSACFYPFPTCLIPATLALVSPQIPYCVLDLPRTAEELAAATIQRD